MTDQELKDLVASLARSQVETSRQQEESNREWKELRAFQKESNREWEELKAYQKETARLISQNGKLIGDIGNKFGRFTEGMAEPSMRKLLGEKFGMTAIHPRSLFHSDDRSRTLEIDVLGYDRNEVRDEVYIVEVKSQLTPQGIDQALKTIADFRELGPASLRHRTIYGVVAAVDIPKGLDKTVTDRGLYLARISDDTFKLLVPRDFKPKAFVYEAPPNGKSNGRAGGRPKKKKT